MKLYSALKVSILNPQASMPLDNIDIGEIGATEHRIKKAGFSGVTPLGGAKTLLGLGGFKKVYTTAGVSPNLTSVTKPIEFVLVKMELDLKTAYGGHYFDKDHTEGVRLALRDVITNMILLGETRNTVYYSNRNKHTKQLDYGSRRIAFYVPKRRGKELASCVGSLNDNDKIRAFCQYYHQIKEMHLNGFSHHDIKPENVMFDINDGATVIDFGGVSRPWRPSTIASPEYSVVALGGNFFIQSILARLNPKFKADAGSYSNFSKAWHHFRGIIEDNIYRVMNVTPSGAGDYSPRLGDYQHLIGGRGQIVGLHGVIYDIASLFAVLVYLGLFWKCKDEALRVIYNGFHPYWMEQLVLKLKALYVGTQPLDKPSPFKIISHAERLELDFDFNPADSLNPDAIAQTIDVRSLMSRGQTEVEAKREIKTRQDTLADSCHLYARFSVGKLVDGTSTKHRVLSMLIDQLAVCWEPHQLSGIIDRILLVSLVNRGGWYKQITETFKTIHRIVVTDPTVAAIFSRYWDLDCTHNISQTQLYEIVQRHFRVQFPQIFTKHKRSEDEILRILGGDFLTMDLGAAESRYRETMLTHLKEMSPGDEFKKTFGRYVSNPVLFDPMVRMTLQADRDLLMQSVMTGYNWIFSPSETVAGLNRYKQEVLRAYTVAGSFGNPYVPAP